MTNYDVNSKYRLYNFMRYRYDWPPELISTYNSLLASCHLPTAAIGCLITPKMLKNGRVPVLYVTLVISLVSVSIEMIDNMWAILIGKTLIGFAQGIAATSTGRMIEEYTPG